MKYKSLFGNSIKADIDEIKKEIDSDPGIVFVYSGSLALYDYIDALYDKGAGLDAEYLYKFKVCYEKRDLSVSYSANGGKRSGEIASMSSLVNELDGKNPCKIIVENNDRVQLAFIVQQLIFIEYPLETVDILLRKEEKDAAKTKRFMKNVEELRDGCETALTRLNELKSKVENESDYNNPTKAKRLGDINDALASCTSIRAQIVKAMDVELKFAVAASKKAGKSVIVNCFLGEEIAPTSTELATPNNCFYKKSPDDKYHLQLEGAGRQEFDNREDIYDVINNHFRAAQNNIEDGFSLPDMNIEYVTKENNFSSYTIFDTAGPDAAGTDHAEAAERAMRKCDVAVFAIDYSKYLTKSEEDYLREVKNIFTAQNKFHSLIFALNKIDVRYTDAKSPKSFIMSVDFIKTRLANIDEAYRDCIIFPTCSLEYFNAIEAENAGITELDAENDLPIGEMKRVKFAHKDVPALAWLHTQSENLEYYHGVKNISYDVFKKDSGMPALMSYVSYVAQSKARDEIVNNVTFEISAQKQKIESVLDYIANIEALINADDEQIGKITGIINDYSNCVQSILSDEINSSDLNVLSQESLLRKYDGNYNRFIEEQSKAFKPYYEKNSVADEMYTATVNAMWNKLNGKDNIERREIEKLFTTEDFKKVANDIGNTRVERAADYARDQLSKIRDDVSTIVKHRQELLCQKSDKCRERLEKEHISLQLPKQPEFEFAAKTPSSADVTTEMKDIDFEIFDKLEEFFQIKFWENIGTFFGKLFGHKDENDYKYVFLATRGDFVKICKKNFEVSFKLAVHENNVPDRLLEAVNKSVVDEYMNDLVNELKQTFNSLNSMYMTYIEHFRSAVDDRDKYKAEIELYNLRKENITAIGDATSKFMDTWGVILHDIVEEEETDKVGV